jgi:hypothetical protein
MSDWGPSVWARSWRLTGEDKRSTVSCMGEREKLSRLLRFVLMGVVVLILLALIWVFIQI